MAGADSRYLLQGDSKETGEKCGHTGVGKDEPVAE